MNTTDSSTGPVMMRAAAIDAPGPPEALTVHELPRPQAGRDRVLVRVVNAGVQPFDTAVRGGWPPPAGRRGFPQVLGNEFAGVVTELGTDLNINLNTELGEPNAGDQSAHGPFTIGQAVVGFNVLGCNAQFVAVPPQQLVAKPAGVPWDVAGGLSGVGQTAHTALEDLSITAGETVLVHGAAGGVGTVFVQLAQLRGATVIGTAAAQHHDYLSGLGVVPIAYGPGELDRIRAAAPAGTVDACFDAAGHDNLRLDVELVADRTRIVTIVDMDLADELGCRSLRSRRSAERLSELVRLVAAGQLRLHTRAVYPLADAAAAHRDVERGHGRGKVVLAVSAPPDERSASGPDDPVRR